MARVLILGGGFGGLSAAATLAPATAAGHEVWLVDRAPRFRVGFRKLWLLVGREAPLTGAAADTGWSSCQRHPVLA